MNPKYKKLLLMAAMGVILIAFLFTLSQKNLPGELVCLGLTAVLFLLTRRRPNSNIKL